jgi:hypothetical protein
VPIYLSRQSLASLGSEVPMVSQPRAYSSKFSARLITQQHNEVSTSKSSIEVDLQQQLGRACREAYAKIT